ncbi:MAG: hypothetical protein NC489_27515 [Ruminococcus flavefaciens]|nr:hypothetical protein [Ruminococcus flavefaciens]
MTTTTNTNSVTIYPCGQLGREFAEYDTTFKKLGIDSYLFERINAFIADGGHLTVISNRYEKLGRKNFPKNPTETETEEINARNYACYLSSIGFFGDRVYKSYTYCGYIPTRLTCVSPDSETKIERIFRFER